MRDNTILQQVDSLARKYPFKHEGLLRAASQNSKSREILCIIEIEDFFKIVGFKSPSKENIERIEAAIDKGLESIPFINIYSEDSESTVVGHEGRHRALTLLGLGYRTMPIVVRSQGPGEIRFGEQLNPKSYDYIENLPITLIGDSEQIEAYFPLEHDFYSRDIEDRVLIIADSRDYHDTFHGVVIDAENRRKLGEAKARKEENERQNPERTAWIELQRENKKEKELEFEHEHYSPIIM